MEVDDFQHTAVNNASAEVKDDGRINVEISRSLSRRLTKIIDTNLLNLPEIASPVYQFTEAWPIRLNILIQVIGSRGDIQPFVALGNELQKHGHRVRLATHDVFADSVRSTGLEFYAVGGDPAELMAYMVKNPGLIPSMESIRAGDIRRKREMIAKMLNGFWNSCVQPDPLSGEPFVAEAIISNPPSFAHLHCAQALGVPLHMMFTMPWTSTAAFAHPLVNFTTANGSKEREAANFLSYDIVELMTWQGLGDLVNQWREDTLGLEHISLTDAPSLLKLLNIPFTYCWSPSLIPKPSDWGANIEVCGFFFREPPVFTPPKDLEAFLSAGSAPVYIGFGSIVIEDPDRLMTMVLKAVKTLGIRAVISKGWSGFTGDDDQDIYFIGDCPHEWLFQHMAAVVHHGGAGTTACGLRYARPTVIVPFFGDQPFWGEMVARSGAGPAPLPYSQLTSRALAAAISHAMTPESRACAQNLAERLLTESGVKAAVKHFHASLPLNALRCDLFPNLPAAWSYRGTHTTVRLSKRAERILTNQGKLDSKKLKLYQSSPINIDSRRWDPFTAIGSASLATAASVADAAAGIITRPYETAKNCGSTSRKDVSETSLDDDNSMNDGTGTLLKTTRAAMSASAHSMGKLVTSSVKGIFVDIPVAAADGFRVVPRFYGVQVTPRDPITGLRNSAAIAGKNFGNSMSDAFKNLVVYTYQGKRDEGALGVAKGLGKGLSSFITNTTAGTLGLVAYPAQGAYRSIRNTLVTSTVETIMKANQHEGDWLLRKDECTEEDSRVIAADFETLRNS